MAVTSSAPAAETIPGTIVPGKGVGRLELGMSESAARRVLRPLGRPQRYQRTRPVRLGRYVEYQYPSFENGFGAISYVVGFRGRRGSRRVVLIDVRTARNATAAGVRVSSPLRRLRTAYRRLDCRSRYPGPPTRCFLGNVRRRHTVFAVAVPDLIAGQPERPPQIARIIVREPFVPVECHFRYVRC